MGFGKDFTLIFVTEIFYFINTKLSFMRTAQNKMIYKRVELDDFHTLLDVCLSKRKVIALKHSNTKLLTCLVFTDMLKNQIFTGWKKLPAFFENPDFPHLVGTWLLYLTDSAK